MHEVEVMTLKDFLIISTAQADKQEDDWDKVANIMATVINYGGMGNPDPVKPQDLFNLRKYNEDVIRAVTSWDDVEDLLNKM